VATYFVPECDSCNTLGIPEKLVDIIITNDVFVVPLSSHKFTINDLVTLITDETIERFNDRA